MLIAWFCLIFIILLSVFSILFLTMEIQAVRVFGFELLRSLLLCFFIIIVTVEIILPIPQYDIKHQPFFASSEPDSKFSLNRILENEAEESGIRFDPGSFKILDSQGMNFHHLFLCEYQINGKEEVRVFEFQKNFFGNMKPAYPLSEAYIIPKFGNSDDFYHDYIEDGIFGGYLVTAGYASENTALERHELNRFHMDQLHPSGYFMWIELVDEPWKSELWKFAFFLIAILLGNRFRRKNRLPQKFYTQWRAGDKIFQVIKD